MFRHLLAVVVFLAFADGAYAQVVCGGATSRSGCSGGGVDSSFITAPATGIDLGSQTTPYRFLYLYGSGTYGTNSFRLGGTAGSHLQITLPNIAGELLSGGSSNQAVNGATMNFIAGGGLRVNTGYRVILGSGNNSDLLYSNYQTPSALTIGVPATSNTLVIGEDADIFAFNYLVPLQVHPTLVMLSANQSLNERGGMRHNGTQLELTDLATTATSTRPVRFMGGSIVASAATIMPTGNVFHVSGTTNIDTITAMGAGTTITLIFDGVLTVGDSTGNIKLPAAFVSTADDTLTLVSDGSSWFYVSQGVN
jgi:hypothetical protein